MSAMNWTMSTMLAGGEVAQVGVLDADLDLLAAGGDQVEVAAV
jgi:hypothetical protein